MHVCNKQSDKILKCRLADKFAKNEVPETVDERVRADLPQELQRLFILAQRVVLRLQNNLNTTMDIMAKSYFILS